MLQRSFADENEFLQNLEMVSEIKPFDRFTAPRVAQLTQRSNQFNLRTVRYTEQEILAMVQAPGYHTLSMTLEDKFGKHGLISAVIMKEAGDGQLIVDTWIMSCRVLKRGMENTTLNCIVETARKNDVKKIIGEYLPTKKNGLVKDHYASLGFSPAGDGRWELDVAAYENKNTFISIL